MCSRPTQMLSVWDTSLQRCTLNLMHTEKFQRTFVEKSWFFLTFASIALEILEIPSPVLYAASGVVKYFTTSTTPPTKVYNGSKY